MCLMLSKYFLTISQIKRLLVLFPSNLLKQLYNQTRHEGQNQVANDACLCLFRVSRGVQWLSGRFFTLEGVHSKATTTQIQQKILPTSPRYKHFDMRGSTSMVSCCDCHSDFA